MATFYRPHWIPACLHVCRWKWGVGDFWLGTWGGRLSPCIRLCVSSAYQGTQCHLFCEGWLPFSPVSFLAKLNYICFVAFIGPSLTSIESHNISSIAITLKCFMFNVYCNHFEAVISTAMYCKAGQFVLCSQIDQFFAACKTSRSYTATWLNLHILPQARWSLQLFASLFVQPIN